MSFRVSGYDYGSPHTQRIEYSSGKAIYIGKADPGTGETEERWQIQKLTYVGDDATEINWANGSNKFMFKWSARTTYTYS